MPWSMVLRTHDNDVDLLLLKNAGVFRIGFEIVAGSVTMELANGEN